MPPITGIVPTGTVESPKFAGDAWTNASLIKDGDINTYAETPDHDATVDVTADWYVTSAAYSGHTIWTAVTITYEVVAGATSLDWRIEFGTTTMARKAVLLGDGTPVAKTTVISPIPQHHFLGGDGSSNNDAVVYGYALIGSGPVFLPTPHLRVYEITLSNAAGAKVEVIG